MKGERGFLNNEKLGNRILSFKISGLNTHKKYLRSFVSSLLIVSFTSTVLLLSPIQIHATGTAPSLGTAGSFSVLGSSTVTNTGSSVLTGNLGVSPGTAITGFPPGIVNGKTYAAGSVPLQAQGDITAAYIDLAGQSCSSTNNLTGQDLGGKSLTPGVYCYSSSAQLTGTLTLNGEGNTSSVFIFQMGSTLTTATNSSISLINGAQACNIFWQVGSSATLGTYTNFKGNILALTSITFDTGANSDGGAYARNGAVTLDGNTITQAPCATTASSTGTTGSTGTSTPASTTNKNLTLPNTGFDTPTYIMFGIGLIIFLSGLIYGYYNNILNIAVIRKKFNKSKVR
ncbi:MAG: ice-binding family protein [Patescibacteria group bacterium]